MEKYTIRFSFAGFGAEVDILVGGEMQLLLNIIISLYIFIALSSNHLQPEMGLLSLPSLRQL
jgi:hypothetical protein